MVSEIKVITSNVIFDNFYPRIKTILLNNTHSFFIDGKIIRGYTPSDGPSILWLRDHTHNMKGFKYFEPDMKSLIEYFLKHQRKGGSFFDYIIACTYKPSSYLDAVVDKTNRMISIRCGVEADVEYLAVEAVYTIWQTTGDDDWMEKCLSPLKRGLNYSLTHPQRWSKEYRLVKRPFTIDTWDFEYGKPVKLPEGGTYHRSEIDKKTKFCIMHGDNSGAYQSCRLLAKMFGYIGNTKGENYWNNKAEEIKIQTNKVCWNGKFYTHQVHIDPVNISGVDENKQLSLSNTYDINRGLPSHQQAVSIIREYQRRRKTVDSFSEWFSIDPPFPFFTSAGWNASPGNYVNGGVMPLVGGELARACFEHGFEKYGVNIFLRYEKMLKDNGAYLWYHRDGKPGKSSSATQPSDGWGASAMLYAFMEGLVGITDELKLFQKVKLSPRWIVTGIERAKVQVEYGASNGSFAYDWAFSDKKITIMVNGKNSEVNCHILLPKNSTAQKVLINGKAVNFINLLVEKSSYVDFEAKSGDSIAIILSGSG